MQRSLKSRIAELERLEQAAEQQPVSIWEPPAPPSFDEALADFDLLLAALGDGRAHVGRLMCVWRNGVEIPSYGLWGMPDPVVCAAGTRVEGLMRDYGAGELRTAAEYIAWTPEQRALAETWEQLVSEEL